MTQIELLTQLEKDNKGILKVEDARKLGISETIFYKFVHIYSMERVGPGIYLSKQGWPDAMYFLHLRFEQIIFSHESALLLHDLTDRDNGDFEVTVKTGYNPTKLKKENIKVFTIAKDLHEVGKIMLPTMFGNLVPAYDLERTICDIVRSRNKMESQTYFDALKRYAKRSDKDILKLHKYAKLFHVDTLLNQYMELLL